MKIRQGNRNDIDALSRDESQHAVDVLQLLSAGMFAGPATKAEKTAGRSQTPEPSTAESTRRSQVLDPLCLKFARIGR